MGFTKVFDYVAGKQDWLANRLPTEGTRADSARIGDLADKDVPVCFANETVGEVKDRLAKTGWDMAVAVSEEGIVLGLLRNEQFAAPADQRIEQVMKLGPSTWRPNLEVERMIRHAQRYQLHHLLITTPDGALVGVLRRSGIERLATTIGQISAEASAKE